MIIRRTTNQPIGGKAQKDKFGGRVDVSPPNSIFLDNEEQQQTVATRGYYYLTPRAQAELPGYSYSGKDCSLIYKYILAPLASFLVNNLTPRWVAPNVITLLGLGLMGLSYSFMWYYCPKLDEGLSDSDSVPRWIFLYNCVAMLCYQTLDNMDGRQARRTKSSSPLGLLFDHGCDAINSLPGSVNWAVACGLGFASDPVKAWFVISCPMTLFYITTWEEYYTHELIMPIVNGPSEGLLAGASFSLISYFWGVQYWHSTTWFDRFIMPYCDRLFTSSASSLIPDGGVSNVDLIFALCIVWIAIDSSIKIFQVGRKYGAGAWLNLFPYLFLIAASTYIGARFPEFLARNTRVCLHLVSAVFAEMVIQLMIDHMSKESYQPYRLTLIPLGALIAVLHTTVSDSFVDEYVLVYSVSAWTYLIMKLKVVINEVSCLLKIWCFDIITPYPSPEVPRLN